LLNWEKKNTIRNSIAHATSSYDAIKDVACFRDERAKKEVTCSLYDFLIFHQELMDCFVSFACSYMLFIIQDSILFVQSLNSRSDLSF